MGVEVKKTKTVDAGGAAPPVVVSEPVVEQPILLETTVISRYAVHGEVYEKGRVYSFTPDQANRMLRLQDDRGIPVFRRYVQKPKVQTLSPGGPVVVDMSSGKGTVTLNDTADSKGRRIEVGDDDELRADGIDIDNFGEGSGDMTLGDLGDAVQV